MKLNFVEDEAKSAVIEFIDADRSVPEMIKSKLIDNKDVEFVGVVKEHPDINKPKLIVKSTKNVRTLILKAVEELQEDIKDLASSLPKK
ncbi:MAG: RpoL/Rpb11 RNA polymerase subunit family protein [Candidatus Micrarchaeaceae archaeon]